MISGNDFYSIVKAMLPLYVAMFLAYGSVRWWKIFTPDQCSGINRFVAIFAVPFLSFHFISMNNPYTMNFRFLAADTLQKIIILVVLGVLTKFTKIVTLEWTVTIFSLATLPNTLVMGVPLLTAMFGDFSESLMVQVVVLQGIIWYTLLLFLFEFRAAKMLIMEQFPETGANIVSFKVDSDVISLDGQDVLETEATVGEDGKLHVRVRKSNASRRSFGVGSLSGVEIYSLSSSAIQTPRGSNVNQSDFYSITGFPGGRLSNFGPAVDVSSTPRQSINFEEDTAPTSLKMSSSRSGMYHAAHNMMPYFQPVNSEISPAVTKPIKTQQPPETPSRSKPHMQQKKVNPDVHTFPRSASAPIGSKGGRLSSDLRGTAQQSSRPGQHGINETQMLVSDHPQNGKFRANEELGSKKGGERIKPAGLESMAVPEEGLFMALQPKMIACGRTNALIATVAKFLLGPLVMVVASIAVGLHGTLLHLAIVQASLSEGIVPFVFAKEYNVYPTMLSFSVIFGMLITVPINLVYYIILEH
ncbi:Auxin efflux carrier [Cynara cardunculus var. scolymus]|uniref:Auxin efflux carrier n=1 Tax=Cynara cardunculus var. scolymus TaxID=59895 RepID=A0A118JXK5_CYNCS|nr:Auxin efflux carrier [Cynara cardunculus var. scolymus]